MKRLIAITIAAASVATGSTCSHQPTQIPQQSDEQPQPWVENVPSMTASHGDAPWFIYDDKGKPHCAKSLKEVVLPSQDIGGTKFIGPTKITHKWVPDGDGIWSDAYTAAGPLPLINGGFVQTSIDDDTIAIPALWPAHIDRQFRISQSEFFPIWKITLCMQK